MKKFSLTLLACVFPLLSIAAPVVTISCDIPKGSSMEYGESSYDRVKSAIDKKPVPKPRLIVNKADGYTERPTFIILPTKKKLIVTWEKELGSPSGLTNPTSEAEVVIFTPDHISAIDILPPFVVTMYSFFPKLGTMFVTEQGTDVLGKNSSQRSFFATCTYTWGNRKSIGEFSDLIH